MDRKLIHYDAWFGYNYERLRCIAGVRSPTEQDAFHDTYLYLRRFILFSDKDIPDYTPFFVTIYRNARRKSGLLESRYVHPDDYMLQLLSTGDDSMELEDIRRRADRERLYETIISFVRRRFSYTDYRMFCLKFITPCLTYQELRQYTGIPVGDIRKRISTIRETIKKEIQHETYHLQ